MDRGRREGGRDDPFNGFGGFGGFGDPFSGFGDPFSGHPSLTSSIFGGRDPFDDPFFSRPFPSMFGPGMMGGGPSMFGPRMLGPGMRPSMFGPRMHGPGMRPSMFGPGPGPFGDSPAGFIDNQQQSRINPSNNGRGPIIEELSSDEEDEDGVERRENPRKHSRSGGGPYVEEPDDGAEDKRVRHMQHRNEFGRTNGGQPQTRSFSFQSSTVSYGGMDGAYYTSSTTKKMGDNGVMIEEKKEADTTTGKAEHRVSKGIRDKGHTVTRKLNQDGKVDTMQTLHNLNEDELNGFEETWKGNAEKHLPGWTEENVHQNIIGSSSGMQAPRQGWALPSTEQRGFPVRSTSHRARPTNG